MSKTAIVTGGARGIGRGCALELAARGYDIALVDLLEPEMARTKGEIEAKGRKALTYKADVAQFARAMREGGRPGPHQVVRLYAFNTPDKVAVVFGDERYTYAEFDQRVSIQCGTVDDFAAILRLSVSASVAAVTQCR